MAQFVSVVRQDTEDVWNQIFREEAGADYRELKLLLYRGLVSSACGRASSATGPFYCPADEKLYIDLSFYQNLKNRFGASGDFAMAYVLAHEVGHHVQNLLGITDRLNRLRGRVPQAQYNDQSVRLKLQADFFAGVWAHHGQKMKSFLEEGDIEEALRAANAIGDDRLQKQAQGYVVLESFTHGTSAQHYRWHWGDDSAPETTDKPTASHRYARAFRQEGLAIFFIWKKVRGVAAIGTPSLDKRERSSCGRRCRRDRKG